MYEEIYKNIVILFDSKYDRHIQFNSSLCPNGIGGSNYSPTHTVCPEDVLYLAYPLANFIYNTEYYNYSNSSMFEITKNDYNYYVPITCKENAGMTTPIHTIVKLFLVGANNNSITDNIAINHDESDLDNDNEINEMMYEFNRSMYGGSYGGYNIRNEVDKHLNIIGAHYDNTHFLTGNGGYLQIFLNGFAGLRIVENGLLFNKPYLLQNIAKLRLRNVNWRYFQLTISITHVNITIAMTKTNVNVNNCCCFVDSKNKSIVFNQTSQLYIVNDLNQFRFPGLLMDTPC